VQLSVVKLTPAPRHSFAGRGFLTKETGKARLEAPDLSVWKISVSCTQGRVALSGTVSAEEDIGEAVALALEADGVRDVTSSLAVKTSR